MKRQQGEEVEVELVETGKRKMVAKDDMQKMNPPKFDKVEDMANLTCLNEASVLYNIKDRYYSGLIYTYSGLFCVVVNPYKRLPIYTEKIIDIYKGKKRHEVPPHVYAITDTAYRSMLQDREDQAILCTGESGAGKTENTKKVIQYLAHVAASPKGTKAHGAPGELEQQLLKANPILEAFGNAKTVKNDNSSRFGKFIRINFDASGYIAGANIETYLLEKARIIRQQSDERTFHIFYQLLTGASEEYKTEFILEDPKGYNFLTAGGVKVPGIDDPEEFQSTLNSMKVMGMSDEDLSSVFRVISACMLFGNMEFKEERSSEQATLPDNTVAQKIAHLLGVQVTDLVKAFLKPRIKVGRDYVTKAQTKGQVEFAIEAIAKATFERLFKWIVTRINRSLDRTKRQGASFIGILDIAGFEIFEVNTFEQLCINFTNEKLQQFFNHHMFVLEQEEYKREGIQWTFIDFGMDLAACIELLEKPMGVFSILEEESIVPKATDDTFRGKLYDTHEKKSPAFVKPKIIKKGGADFIVLHYAGQVGYNVDGWLFKNKDPLNDSVLQLFRKSSNAVMSLLFPEVKEEVGARGKKKKQKGGGFQTVSALYREQLNKLMTNLRNTKPHFVRCIIPNERKKCGEVDPGLIIAQLRCNGVLEGIRICRKGFPNRLQYPEFKQRYKILPAKKVAKIVDSKKATETIVTSIELDLALYKIGHTKIFFKAGVLADLEDKRDELLAIIMTKLQSRCCGKLLRIEFKKMVDRFRAAKCIQRNIRKFVQFRDWHWWKLYTRVKPLLNTVKAEDELKAKDAQIKDVAERFEKETQLRKDYETKCVSLLSEKNNLTLQLQAEQENLADSEERNEQLVKVKQSLETEVAEMTERLDEESTMNEKLTASKKKLEKQNEELSQDLESAEGNIKRMEKEKSDLESKVRNLSSDLDSRDGSIAALQKEKKHLEQVQQQTVEDLQAMEDKANHLSKIKSKLEAQMEETEDALEQERKIRSEMEKAKRKFEADLRAATDNIADLQRDKTQLEESIRKKDFEINSLNGKLEDEQNQVYQLSRKVKELQARVEDLESELENERNARAKAERARSDLTRELDQLTEQLEEAGGASAAQSELIKRREADLCKIRRDYEEAIIQHEADITSLKKRQNDAVTELVEQVENLTRVKTKVEKERSQLQMELLDVSSQLEEITKIKIRAEANVRVMEEQYSDSRIKIEENSRLINELTISKNKLQSETAENMQLLEEAENKVNAFARAKSNMTSLIEDLKRQLEEESKNKQSLTHALQAARHDLDLLREQVEEEQEGKAELQRALSKANAEITSWRTKYESDAIQRMEELEEAKKKLAIRLQEVEEQTENALAKCASLEKTKVRLTNELEDLNVDLSRSTLRSMPLTKSNATLTKEIATWKQRVEEIQSELDASQRESRNYQTEVYKLRSSYEESIEQLEIVKRENKNLSDEINDLTDQLTTGGKSLHEMSKSKKKAELETEELRAALEEAEGALELEESRVLRSQLELTQVKADIDRKLQEKDEEFDSTRKNYARSLESMQASLDIELKARADAVRSKKKFESQLNDVEMQLEHANKNLSEQTKTLKKYQVTIKDMQDQMDEDQRNYDEMREQYGIQESKLTIVMTELDETRSALESNGRSRKQAEVELLELTDRVNNLSAQNSALSSARRKLETENEQMRAELDEALSEVKGADERAKKAVADAGRMAEELRQEQQHLIPVERVKKTLEAQIHELTIKLEEAEAYALKGGRKALAAVQSRMKDIEGELDGEQRRHAETLKNYRKMDRRLKELTFQADEDRKNQTRMQELVEKLQLKLKQYKKMAEDAEEQANQTLAKFRKVPHDLEEAEERADMSESALNKVRSKSRFMTTADRGSSNSAAGFSMSISRKVVSSSSSTTQ